jgi:hypothetical protein
MSTTGQAAGTAAALCVKTGVVQRELDVQLLQKMLKKRGALVGSEVISTYRAKKLPSRITIGEAVHHRMKESMESWKKLGQV